MNEPSQPIVVEGPIARALSRRDLTDPGQGPHAVQRVVDAAAQALAREWGCPVELHRGGPLVPLADHGDRLGEPRPPGSGAGDYVLRARAAATVPPLLGRLAASMPPELLLVCPALVHRDGPEGPATHELDLWRLQRGAPLSIRDLARMVAVVARAVAPGRTLSAAEDAAPWLDGARRLDLRVRRSWLAAGRAGLVRPEVLAAAGLPADASAMALTLDLDRLVMVAKGIEEPALLRDERPEVAAQLLDLEPYLPAGGGVRAGPADLLAPPGSATAPRSLEEVRSSIDALDRHIVKLLSQRRAFALQAARFKRAGEVRVPAREQQVLDNVRALARAEGIEAELVEGLYRHLMDELVRLERAAQRAAAPAGSAA
jgi:phenylalanyl-tRNA synthetase alpha chain